MTLLYSESCFLLHETDDSPERAERIAQIPEQLTRAGLAGQCQRPTWEPIARRRLTRLHRSTYVDSVFALSKAGGGEIEEDTMVGPSSFSVALQAAGATCDAVERVVRGEDRRALCLVRPPGHHALFNHAMGFCLFNNVAIAAKAAVAELQLDRVLIVDWDIHHGNGTQEAFWEDPQVGFLSIHRHPFYPYTGMADETGLGDGAGTTLNVPIEYGTPREQYFSRFRAALELMAERMRPQLVLISAGFDTHHADPIGDLGLESGDFATLTRMVVEVANVHAQGRVVSVLEGGYNPTALAESVEVHLADLMRP